MTATPDPLSLTDGLQQLRRRIDDADIPELKIDRAYKADAAELFSFNAWYPAEYSETGPWRWCAGPLRLIFRSRPAEGTALHATIVLGVLPGVDVDTGAFRLWYNDQEIRPEAKVADGLITLTGTATLVPLEGLARIALTHPLEFSPQDMNINTDTRRLSFQFRSITLWQR